MHPVETNAMKKWIWVYPPRYDRTNYLRLVELIFFPSEYQNEQEVV
jgi:hypothetical protein